MTKRIKLYGSTNCPGCKRVIRFLHEHNLGYDYIDVYTHEGNEKFRELGISRIPIVIYGEKQVVGFNRPKLEKLLLTEEDETGETDE